MKPHRGVLYGLLAGMLWGLDGVLLGRADSNGVLRAALIAACIHDGLAARWLFAVNAKNKKIKMYRNCLFSWQFRPVFVCALFGGAAGMTCNIIAINMAGASSACAVTSAYPVAGAVLGALFLHEKLTASSAGAFSYFCWYRSMDISGVTVGMSLNATYAMWAVLLDIPVNGVSFSPQIFAGAVIILSGTLLTIYSGRKKEKQDEQQK